MGKNILLVYPGKNKRRDKKLSSPPLGILVLAFHLKKNGYSPFIFDQRVTSVRTLNYLLNEKNWLAVGIYARTSKQLTYGTTVAQLVKKCYPSLPIVWGGPHATDAPETLLSRPEYCDYTVIGEGEKTFIDLLNSFSDRTNLSSINGIGYRQSNGKISISSPISFWEWEEPEYLPFELISRSAYKSPIFHYESSRGCPFDCDYCAYHAKMRYKPINFVKKELTHMIKYFEISGHLNKRILVVDDHFLANPSRSYEIFDFLAKNNVQTSAYCRADAVCKLSPKFIELLSSCRRLSMYLGGGFGNDDINEKINKRLTKKEILDSAKIAPKLKNAIFVYGFVFGHPHEKKEHLNEKKEILSQLLKTSPNVTIFCLGPLYPFPNTKIYHFFKQLNIALPNTLEEWANLYKTWNTYSVWKEKNLIRRVVFYDLYVYFVSLLRILNFDSIKLRNKSKKILTILLFPLKLLFDFRWKQDICFWFFDIRIVRYLRKKLVDIY